MIGQKSYSLKHKHSGVTPEDARPAKDKNRPVIVATRASGGSSKKKSRSRKVPAITKGDNDKK